MKNKSILKINIMAMAILLGGMTAFNSMSQSANTGDVSASAAETGKPFKTITNAKSGDIATVDSARKKVTLHDRNNNQIWVVEPAKEIQKNNTPVTGTAEIRDIRFDDAGKNLLVTVGKATFLAIDVKSGALSFQGSD